jgi:hypothetical protein
MNEVVVLLADNRTRTLVRGTGMLTTRAAGGGVTATARGVTAVRGATQGGHIVTLRGDNFGAADYGRRCLFVAWRGRTSDAFACA